MNTGGGVLEQELPVGYVGGHWLQFELEAGGLIPVAYLCNALQILVRVLLQPLQPFPAVPAAGRAAACCRLTAKRWLRWRLFPEQLVQQLAHARLANPILSLRVSPRALLTRALSRRFSFFRHQIPEDTAIRGDEETSHSAPRHEVTKPKTFKTELGVRMGLPQCPATRGYKTTNIRERMGLPHCNNFQKEENEVLGVRISNNRPTMPREASGYKPTNIQKRPIGPIITLAKRSGTMNPSQIDPHLGNANSNSQHEL